MVYFVKRLKTNIFNNAQLVYIYSIFRQLFSSETKIIFSTYSSQYVPLNVNDILWKDSTSICTPVSGTFSD